MFSLILFLGLILRVVNLNQSLWLDEAINVMAAQQYSLIGMITEYAKGDFHPPLFFIMLWIWTKIFGSGEVFVRLPSVIFGVLTIYLIYKAGKKLHSKTLGLLSALLLAINPLHIYYSQEARMYALAALAVVVNFFILIKLLKGEKVKLFYLILSNLFVLLSDYVAYFIFPSQLFFLLLSRQINILRFWIKGFCIACLLIIWWIPIFLSQLKIGFAVSTNLPSWKLIVGYFDFKTIPLTFVKFIIGRIGMNDKALYYILIFPVCSFFLFLILRGVSYMKNAKSILLICWLLIPIFLATLISFIIPVYSYFRLLFVLPSFVILLALGIISFQFQLRYIFLVMVLLISIFSSCVYLFNPTYQREDWKGLVKFLSKKRGEIIFESSGTFAPFDYYSKEEIAGKGALKNFPAKNPDDLISIDSLLNNSSDVYLINYLVEISDPDKLVKQRLISLGYIHKNTYDFRGVGFVYHFVKNDK